MSYHPKNQKLIQPLRDFRLHKNQLSKELLPNEQTDQKQFIYLHVFFNSRIISYSFTFFKFIEHFFLHYFILLFIPLIII